MRSHNANNLFMRSSKKVSQPSQTAPKIQVVSQERKSASWTIKNPHAAGIDLGSRRHFVAVPPDSVAENESFVRDFGPFTDELQKMVEWLKACGVKTVAMESTGVDWVPVYRHLDRAGLEVILVNTKQRKHAPQRKTDVMDCQWIQQLHSYGLLSGSFVPEELIQRFRILTRHRERMIDRAKQDTQPIQKALTEMNVPLHHVISDVMGETGQRILKAILAGERDPDRLLELRDEQISLSTKAQMRSALIGDYRGEQVWVIGQAYESFLFAHQQIEATDVALEKLLGSMAVEARKRREAMVPADKSKAAPVENSEKPSGEPPKAPGKKKPCQTRKRNDPKVKLEPLLSEVFGIDLTQVLGFRVLGLLVLLAEVGFDLSRFPNAKAFASWLGLCPNNKISGGKVLSRRTKHVVNRLSIFLRMSAVALGRTETTLGWFYRRQRAQLGPSGAATATARKLACLVYHLIKKQEVYVEPDLLKHKIQYNQRRRSKLIKQIEQLGYEVIVKPKKETETLQTCE
mgnify:CR=1 FL=1